MPKAKYSSAEGVASWQMLPGIPYFYKKKIMKSIEIKSEGYTYRYDFDKMDSNDETFDPGTALKVEPLSSAEECLRIFLGFLDSIYGSSAVNEALQGIRYSGNGERL